MNRQQLTSEPGHSTSSHAHYSREELQARRDAHARQESSVDSWLTPKRLGALAVPAVAAGMLAGPVGGPAVNTIDDVARHMLSGQEGQLQANQRYLDQEVKPSVEEALRAQGIVLTTPNADLPSLNEEK